MFHSYAEVLLSSQLCYIYAVTHKCRDSRGKTADKSLIFFPRVSALINMVQRQ